MIDEQQINDNQPTRLKNIRCGYCNADFIKENEPQKEHVIGLNFTPKGSHNNNWNLHINACERCNQEKSRLENDLSAITILSGSIQNETDALASREADRKSKAFSQRTGKRIDQSSEHFEIKGNIGGASLSFQLACSPQFDDQRAFTLAWYQIAGFFFFLTYNQEEQMGYHWPGRFYPLGAFQKNDWGNSLLVSFSQNVKDWEMRLHAENTANGYYKVLIKKNPDAKLWSWAIEWNKSTRVFGFLGEENEAQNAKRNLDFEDFGPWISQDGGQKIRVRREHPLDQNRADSFFYRN